MNTTWEHAPPKYPGVSNEVAQEYRIAQAKRQRHMAEIALEGVRIFTALRDAATDKHLRAQYESQLHNRRGDLRYYLQGYMFWRRKMRGL